MFAAAGGRERTDNHSGCGQTSDCCAEPKRQKTAVVVAIADNRQEEERIGASQEVIAEPSFSNSGVVGADNMDSSCSTIASSSSSAVTMKRLATYVGRIAPTPSGHLHIGHAQTFLIAKKRAEQAGGKLILRIEDLDAQRCKAHYYDEMIEDLKWMGLDWQIGPGVEDVDNVIGTSSSMIPFMASDYLSPTSVPTVSAAVGETVFSSSSSSPSREQLIRLNSVEFKQTGRMPIYRAAFRYLLSKGYIYPSPHSRKDVEAAISAPHEGDTEVLFPSSLRPPYMQVSPRQSESIPEELRRLNTPAELATNWRLCVPDGEVIEFTDGRYGPQRYVCGQDIGDFVIWRGSDNIPSYEFAVVVDDLTMGVTEVVRGFDLLQSTSRQLLLYRAFLEQAVSSEAISSLIPQFYHCPLIRDANGVRLAKRSFSQSIRTLRESGKTVDDIIHTYFDAAIIQEFWNK
jgi:glutamyl/glutaminyl-tRNA synthetase